MAEVDIQHTLTVHYQQDDFGCHSYEKINEIRRLEQLCDVTIMVDDGGEFAAHRLVLAASSAYFRAMFTNDMVESRSPSVRIQGIDSRTIGDLIEVRRSLCRPDMLPYVGARSLLPW